MGAVLQSGRYGLAVALTAIAALLRWSVPGVFASSPYLSFYPAVVAAAAWGGLGPGLLATAGSLVCVDLLFDSTPGRLSWTDPGAIVRLALFAAGGVGVSVIAGRMRAAQGDSSDSTARRRAEQEWASIAQFPEENPNPVLRLAGDAALLYTNHAARRLLAVEGWQPGEPAPAALRELTEDVMRRGEPGEADLACCDGRVFSFTCVPLAAKGYANLYGRDVTQTRHVEQQLRKGEQRYRSFVEASSQVVWTTNAVGEVDMELPAWQAFTGQTAAEARGFGWMDAILPEHHQRVSEAWRKAVESRGLYEVEYLLRRHDGAWRHILARGVPVFEADGRVREYIGTCIDVTERKQAEEQLKQAKREADASNEAKSRFLTNMSHEIRTPMNAIIGLTALALEEDLAPGARDCLETVKSSADNLLVLLNELLDFSRIESGKLQLESLVFPFRAVVEQSLKALSIQARQKGLSLWSDIAVDVPDALVGDRHRLRQILVNLVGNAIKYTEQGEVSVRVSVDGADAGRTRLRIEVADTGIGIAPDEQARIFEPFTQVDPSLTRRFSGTGLGLAICSRLVVLMGGRLGVRSAPGQGSVFSFAVPFGRPRPLSATTTAPEPRAELPPLQRPLRILLAEDTPGNQTLITRLLGKRGHAIVVAANGEEAVELVRRQGGFDLVLMDIQMPVMDGFEATAEIRALAGGDKCRLPIVAMTAHAMRGDRERCLAAGMDDYVAKPIDARALIELVERMGTPAQNLS